MIAANILGGLGNMMFVIAATEYLAKTNNTTAFYPNVEEHLKKVQNDRTRVYPASDVSTQDYKKIFRNFNWTNIGDTKYKIFCTFSYSPVQFRESCLYLGYFQTEKYFPDRQHILNLFEPSDFVLSKIKKYEDILTGETCSIHVRRGDYSLDQESKHHTKNMDWYNKSINLINADRYLVFSDDVDYAKENFIGDKYHFIEDKDYIELFLMSMCKHNIIASSSFSWWGAWLNKNPEKKVIAPKVWFGKIDPGYPDFDIVPKDWIKL